MYAQVLAACQTATIFNACEHGLGQHFEVLSTNDRDIFFKVTTQQIPATEFGSNLFTTEPICDKHNVHRLPPLLQIIRHNESPHHGPEEPKMDHHHLRSHRRHLGRYGTHRQLFPVPTTDTVDVRRQR